MICNKFLLIVLLINLHLYTQAQERYIKIEGRVMNEKFEPVSFTNIRIKGKAPFKTDINGYYSVLCMENSEMNVSRLGYKEKTIKINKGGVYNLIVEKNYFSIEKSIEIDSNKLMNEIYFEIEKIKEKTNSQEPTKIYTVVQLNAYYHGRLEGVFTKNINDYLSNNPSAKILPGEFEIEFEVAVDGRIKNLFIHKGLSPETDTILYRALLKTSGGWSPLQENGNNFNSFHRLKIIIIATSGKLIDVQKISINPTVEVPKEEPRKNNEIPGPKIIIDKKPIPNDVKGKKIKEILEGYDFAKIFSKQMYQNIEKPNIPDFEKSIERDLPKYLNKQFYNLIERKLYDYYSNDDLEYILIQQQQKGKYEVAFLNDLCLQQCLFLLSFLYSKGG